jgi:hypothetical protein
LRFFFEFESQSRVKCFKTRKTLPVLSLIDPNRYLVLTKCPGKLTRGELIVSFQELALDSQFKGSFRQLIDLSLASVIELTYNDLTVFHRLHDPFSPDARRALFARQGSANYGVARMFQGIANVPGIRTFDSLRDALSWIDLEPSTLTRDLKRWLAFDARPKRRARA